MKIKTVKSELKQLPKDQLEVEVRRIATRTFNSPVAVSYVKCKVVSFAKREIKVRNCVWFNILKTKESVQSIIELLW